MEFFPSLMTAEESNAFAEKIIIELQEKQYGLWAVEIPNVASFIGFIGLHYQDFPAKFTPCIEIGWRLAYEYWKKGYATEGGKAALDYGFNTLGINEIVSFTYEKNQRSTAVMNRLGLTRQPQNDFEHPKLAPGHWLRPHVFYHILKDQWLQRKDSIA